MRIFPILTAVAVTIALYFVVMQRDMVRAWLGDGTDAATTQAPAQTDTADTGNTISVVVRHSVAQEVKNGIVLRGRTEAARRIDVRAETSGRVISAPLAKGTGVATGQVLCRLDPGARPAQLAEAEARLANAQVSADNAAELAKGGFGPQNAVVAANAGLEAARAGVERIRRDIANLEITAPFAGSLETDTAEIGSLMQPGGLCAKIIALDEIRLVGFATEQDINRLTIGARAGARLVSGRQVTGKVTFLARASDPVTRTFRVEVTVANPDLSIRDGETAEIVVQLASETAHLLPNNVLVLNDSGALGVRIAVDGVARFVPVTILRDTENGLWIKGLPDTADVIVVGQAFVVDGSPIVATPQEAAK